MDELLFQSKEGKLANGSSVVITKINGDINDRNVNQFSDKLLDVLNQKNSNFILIFPENSHLDDRPLASFLSISLMLPNIRSIGLVGLSEKTIYDMRNYLSRFKICDSEEDALLKIN